MSTVGPAVVVRLASALAETGASVERPAPHRWTLRYPRAAPILVSWDEGWMSWSLPLPADVDVERPSGDPWPGGVKTFRSAGGRAAAVQCDWPASDEVDVERRVREIAARFSALASAGTHAMADEAHTGPGDGIGVGMSLADLRVACEGAGWTVTAERDSGLSVAISGASLGPPAEIALGEADGVRVHLELARASTLDPAAARAIGAVLAAAAGRVRFARPYVDRGVDGGIGVGFEVDLGRGPMPIEVTHALGAVAAASAECRNECALLLDQPEVAGRMARLMAGLGIGDAGSS